MFVFVMNLITLRSASNALLQCLDQCLFDPLTMIIMVAKLKNFQRRKCQISEKGKTHMVHAINLIIVGAPIMLPQHLLQHVYLLYPASLPRPSCRPPATNDSRLLPPPAARKYCHSPTQPQLELVFDLIMGRDPPTTPPPGTFKALPGNLGSWFSVCNLIFTQLERLPQKKNGRRPQKK